MKEMAEKQSEKITERQEQFLSVCFDWVQITVKTSDDSSEFLQEKEVVEELLGIDANLFIEDSRGAKGLKGYYSWGTFGEIRILRGNGRLRKNGVLIIMTGKGCRDFEKVLNAQRKTWYEFFYDLLKNGKYNINFPRVDIAIDDKLPHFKIKDILELSRSGCCDTRMEVGGEYGKFKLKTGESKGSTVDFGSRESLLRITFYEKGYEQAEKMRLKDSDIEKNWNRYELKYKQEKAVNFIKEFIKNNNLKDLVFKTLNDSICFRELESDEENIKNRPIYEPWKIFMDGIEKIKISGGKKENSFSIMCSWLEKSVVQSLKMLKMIDREYCLFNFESLLNDVSLSDKNQKLLKRYKSEMEIEMKFQDLSDGNKIKIRQLSKFFYGIRCLFYDCNMTYQEASLYLNHFTNNFNQDIEKIPYDFLNEKIGKDYLKTYYQEIEKYMDV